MESKHHDPFDDPVIPFMELLVEPSIITPGEPVIIRWKADAEHVLLGHIPVGFTSFEPENWTEIEQWCEPVDHHGEKEAFLEQATAFYLIARNSMGIVGLKEVAEWPMDELQVRATTWSPQPQHFPLMEDRSKVLWIPEYRQLHGKKPFHALKSAFEKADVWHAGPSITLSASPNVVFLDETAKLSWSISNATCSNMGYSTRKSLLLSDATKVSGTKQDGGGWGAGGSPPCALKNGSGTWNVTPLIQKHGPFHLRASIQAENPSGAPVLKWQWLDALSVPKFSGCSGSRQTAIRNAIRGIDKRLRAGCIFHDTSLDSNVDAFKKKHLDRKQFWWSLVTELQNLNLDTFVCQDVADKDWSAGQWQDYTNNIIVQWSPSHKPYLEYVILHELCHKVGFNGSLLGTYSHAQIENQAHLVSGACYP